VGGGGLLSQSLGLCSLLNIAGGENSKGFPNDFDCWKWKEFRVLQLELSVFFLANLQKIPSDRGKR
jgi:hypothetical protein